jgi:hypothetical protein
LFHNAQSTQEKRDFCGISSPRGRSVDEAKRSFQAAPALPAATAEIMTKACASGQSSVMERSIWAT